MNALELKIPPLAVALVAAVLMWLIASGTPAFSFQLPWNLPLLPPLAFIGGVIAISGIVAFRYSKTTVNPMKPGEASTLVTSGVYRITRNPMYLGLLFLLTGWAFHLSNVLAFLPIPIFMVYMTRFQIIPEERALLAAFGEDYAAYCSKVRRWL